MLHASSRCSRIATAALTYNLSHNASHLLATPTSGQRLGKIPFSSEAGATSSMKGDTPAPLVKAQFDYKSIRQNADMIRVNMKNRNYSLVDMDEVVALIEERSKLLTPIGSLRARRNQIADAVFRHKTKKPLPDDLPEDLRSMAVDQLIAEGSAVKEEITRLEARADEVLSRLDILAHKIPNDTHPTVPIGDESNARVLHHANPEKGTVAWFTQQGMVPRDHMEIARLHGLIDLDAASKVSGSRFYFLTREAALLELALVNWTMQKLVAKGYIPTLTPDVARVSVIEGAGFQSKDDAGLGHHIYFLSGTDAALVGTAEIPLAGKHMNEIMAENTLPLKMAAFSHCFRTEVGGLGQATKGIYRVHQFSKVEMFVICTPEQGEALHEELIAIEQELFEELGLNFKVLEMPTGDLGAPAYRKVDMEACMPGRAVSLQAVANPPEPEPTKSKPNKQKGKKSNAADDNASPNQSVTSAQSDTANLSVIASIPDCYGEISSTSNCTDYQARRLGLRFRSEIGGNTGEVRHAYTLNGTACAVPRMIVAILEQNQQKDGTVIIPEPLRPFLGGHERIPFLPRNNPPNK